MNSHYPQDLSALADRPDFEIPPAPQTRTGLFRRFARAVLAAGVFAGVTLGVAVVFFVPVFLFNLSRIEALEVAGELMPASVFVDQLGALFWGTAVIALAFTSFDDRPVLHGGRYDNSPAIPARQQGRSLDASDCVTVERL